MTAKKREDEDSTRSGTKPVDVMRNAAQAAWQAPWALVSRAVESQTAMAEDWQRNLLSLAGHNAVFKTRVQKSGRVSIPDAEREALGLDEGDLVQVVVIPIAKSKKSEG